MSSLVRGRECVRKTLGRRAGLAIAEAGAGAMAAARRATKSAAAQSIAKTVIVASRQVTSRRRALEPSARVGAIRGAEVGTTVCYDRLGTRGLPSRCILKQSKVWPMRGGVGGRGAGAARRVC